MSRIFGDVSTEDFRDSLMTAMTQANSQQIRYNVAKNGTKQWKRLQEARTDEALRREANGNAFEERALMDVLKWEKRRLRGRKGKKNTIVMNLSVGQYEFDFVIIGPRDDVTGVRKVLGIAEAKSDANDIGSAFLRFQISIPLLKGQFDYRVWKPKDIPQPFNDLTIIGDKRLPTAPLPVEALRFDEEDSSPPSLLSFELFERNPETHFFEDRLLFVARKPIEIEHSSLLGNSRQRATLFTLMKKLPNEMDDNEIEDQLVRSRLLQITTAVRVEEGRVETATDFVIGRLGRTSIKFVV